MINFLSSILIGLTLSQPVVHHYSDRYEDKDDGIHRLSGYMSEDKFGRRWFWYDAHVLRGWIEYVNTDKPVIRDLDSRDPVIRMPDLPPYQIVPPRFISLYHSGKVVKP